MIQEELRLLITSLGYQVPATADNVDDFVRSVAGSKPDLAILDVEVKGDKTGIHAAQQLKELNIPFLFVTSFFDEQTIGLARETGPLGYVVKPFKDADIKTNLSLAFHKMGAQSSEAEQKVVEHLFVRTGKDMVRILPEDIEWLRGDDNYTHIYTSTKQYTVAQTLKSLVEKLDGQGFARVHKSYMVNLNAIQNISGNLIYINGEGLPIGKTFKPELFKRLTIL